MHNPKKPFARDEQRLADQLKTEAELLRPTFSDSLHARIMQRVASFSEKPFVASAESPRSAPSQRVQPGSRSLAIWAQGAVAAALLLGIAIARFGLPERNTITQRRLVPPQVDQQPVEVATTEVKPTPEETLASTAPAEPIGETVMLDQTEILDQTANLVESTLASQQWAYLGHDAQVLANLLFDQLPSDTRAGGDL